MSEQSLTAERVRADVAEVLGVAPEELAGDADLLDLGLDSVRVMGLVERWRAAGAEVEFPDLAEQPELAHWTALVVGS
ncbi:MULTISPECIES: phosphopantetheine-binding protein [Actinosynnema]|uniref:Phosphopantetheine-binding domain-containing protein n=2 Tax=Actinosynnema pretiosum TaxID=42197 RepID=A0A4Y6A5Z8_9PSEU|nr:phosphopantetheine-binding protein [Actinosynnema pretiosum]ATE54235.1 acyl carrier protein [Actinosynnema pretiosum]MCP2092232.1 Aryl carrier domain-containing protein [Actinosynnema pretiosum]QDE53698.1 phosphopantetheine-binding domain-containing protein [Actinosynnema pretiosum subsp. pretiosum]